MCQISSESDNFFFNIKNTNTKNIWTLLRPIFSMLLLLLSCATWKAKLRIEFKAKWVRCFWEARPILLWQESYFYLFTIEGSTIHHHISDISLKGWEIFSWNNNGKLVTTDHGIFGHAFNGSLRTFGIELEPSGATPDDITTMLPTAGNSLELYSFYIRKMYNGGKRSNLIDKILIYILQTI